MLRVNLHVHVKYSYTHFVLFCVLLISCVTAHSQISSWNHIHYTTKNGLPSNSVRNCVQDRDGFIWISTESGLCRFDGDEFKSIFHDPNDSTSIPSDYINHVAMGADGHLLVSTMNGFFIMNTKTMRGKTIKLQHRKGWEKLENTFGRIYVHNELKQIIVYNGTSIHYFDFQFRLLHSVTYPFPVNNKPQHFLVGNLCYLPDGDIIFWSGVTQKFEYLDYQSKRITTCDKAENQNYAYLSNIKNVNIFNWDSDRNLWYCVHDIDSLFCFQATTKKRISKPLEGQLKNINWTSVINFPDSQTVLMPYAKWDANELYEFLRTDFVQQATFQIKPRSFSGFTVASSSLFVDKDKNWWMTSLDGLYFLKKEYKYFERIDLPVPYGRKFDWQYVTSLNFLSRHEMLITTYAEHCFLYNHTNNTIRSYLDTVPIGRAWNHCMYGILQLGNDRRLIAGCRTYLFANNQLSYPVLPENDFERLLLNNSIEGYIRDYNGNLWVSVSSVGLVQFNYLTKAYKIFPPDSTFPSGNFQLTSYDSASNLYFATRSEASVWKYGALTHSFEKIQIGSDSNDVDWIRDIAVDDKENIYLNTHQNLFIYSLRNKSTHTLRMSDGLPSNVLNAIFYFKHKLYLSSNAGLGILNTEDYSLRIISDKDGILDNATSGYMNYDTLTDRLYIGGKGCIYRVHSDSCWLIPAPAKIIIDRMTINNKPYVNLGKKADLSHDENNICIDLSSIDYLSGANKKYYFKITHSGTNNEWQQSATKQINLLNLSPGLYEIQFRSKDADNHWSANNAKLTFNILPPWYQRWWFYVLLLAVTGGGVYTIYRNKIGQLKRIEIIRTKLSRDLHDDIGSTLSSINILSRTAQRNTPSDSDEKIMSSLEKIHERSQRLLTNMSDIIWNINPGNDTIEELMSRIREYSTAMMEAKEIEFSFKFTADKSRKLTMELKSNLYLIFKEAVNNLVKYSDCKHAQLTLSFDNKQIYLKVEDDGRGFDINEVRHRGGLRNMQYRAEEMNGILNIVSARNSGTRVELTIHLSS